MLLVALSGLVTLQFASLPLPQALERLSQATGRRLVCSETLRDEVLVARLKDADEERVMREIAFAFDARWDEQSSRLALTPDPRARAARAAAARRLRTDTLAKSLVESLKPLIEHPRFGRAEAQALLKQRDAAVKARAERMRKVKAEDDSDDQPPESTPASRANLRLAKAMGIANLLAMQSGERNVYAERPTPMQRGFSADAESILADYRREQAFLDPLQTIARVRLAVSYEPGEGFTFMLQAFEPHGEIVDGDALMLRDSPESDETEPKPSTEKPLDLPAETRDVLALVARGAARDDLSPAWRTKIADPVTNEPTAPSPGGLLVAAAEARGQNLIGTVSELSARLIRPRTPINAASVLEAMRGNVALRDGWLIAKPLERPVRAARADVRDLFAHCVAQGGLDVDTAGDWCTRYPGSHPAIDWVGNGLALLVTRTTIGFDPDEVGLWAALPLRARTALREGRSVRVVDLPEAARERVAQRVYWTNPMESLETEPTETVPAGVLGGTLSLKIEENPVALSWAETVAEPLLAFPLTPERFGTRAASQERTGKTVFYAHFRMGLHRAYTITLDFPNLPKAAAWEMGETFFNPKGVPVAALPTAFVKQADEAKQKALETIGD